MWILGSVPSSVPYRSALKETGGFAAKKQPWVVHGYGWHKAFECILFEGADVLARTPRTPLIEEVEDWWLHVSFVFQIRNKQPNSQSF